MDFLNSTPVSNSKLDLPPFEKISPLELQTSSIHPPVIVAHYLYADVRILNAAGGTGKTTLTLFEAVQLALGRKLWGRSVLRPCRTAIVTREDTREILVARLREILDAELAATEMPKDEAESLRGMVLDNVVIYDLTGTAFRVSKIESDVVKPDGIALDSLMERLEAFNPDWVVFDPLVSFGVGEARVNDAEQGLIDAFRIIRNKLKCCVQGIHHTGKANAREKTQDQYSGRGGSSLPDGARMVAVLHPMTPNEWAKATGDRLAPKESGLVMHLPKLSYCRPQQPIYIKRHGYRFEMVEASNRSPEQESAAIVEQLFQFITDQYRQGRYYSKTDLGLQTETLGLKREQIRTAATELCVSGRVLYQEVIGRKGSHYEPVDLAGVGRGDTDAA